MNHKTKLAFTIALAIGACPVLTHATNGMNSEGTGPKSRGMGGAGVAMANEAQSIINNPAAVTALGNRRDMALGLFSPDERGFEITGNGAIFNQAQTSEKKIFPIPFYGFSKALDDGAAWAFTLSAAGGMNTDYATNFGALAGDPGHTGIDLAQMFFGGTYGAKLSDSTSWGVTVSLAYQQFSAEGLQRFDNPPTSESPGFVTNKGTDSSTGIGLKVGFLGDLSNGATWGASYQFKTDMSKFDDYKGLFANQGELDIAPTLTLGIAYPIGDGKTLAVDYHYIDYEAV
ncbi:MAG: long-chain fatty acid transporter, partial [Aestuariibacter sp.]|nr:long-chain fatty acid transporter [Aestuariibacter sp.]